MNTNQSLKKLRLFAASPADVANERARLATVVEELRSLAEHVGVMLELVDWRKVVPDLKRPEQVILDQLQPTTWDLFIGILWHRFGTPTKGIDLQTGKEYLSGTEEEFRLAYRLWEQDKRPYMMFYWCKRNPPYDELDPGQFKQVRDFFAGFAPDKDHPGLYQTFDSSESFERLVRQNLTDFLLEYSQKEKGCSVSIQEVQALAPRPSDTLPRRSPFFGRKDEIAQALSALNPEDRGWGVVIDGIGGIGKTALAIEVAYICKERSLFDAFIYVTAKRDRLEPTGIKEITLAAATLDGLINEAARALGRPGIAQLTGEEKARALLAALRDRRALVIFDNLETLTTAEQNMIGDFLRNLPQDSKAIVTSRRRTGEAAVTMRLEKLHWEEARELIADQMAKDANLQRLLARVGEEGWKQLYADAGGSPLALLWTIGLMRARGLSFEKALALLRNGSAESDLNAFIYREAQKTMDANERVALGALSLFGEPATFEALSATAGLDRRALDSTLERLRALSLLDLIEGDTGEERYTLHSLTRRFARADLATDAKTEYVTGMRFARYWINYGKKYSGDDKENYKTYNRIKAEWQNLEAATNWVWETATTKDNAVIDKEAAQLMIEFGNVLQNFLWLGGHWDEHLQLSMRIYEVACEIADWKKAGWCAYDLAWINYNRGRYDEAERWAETCAKAWARTEDRRNRAIVIQLRGLLAKQNNDDNEAGLHYREALGVWRNLNDPANAANALNALGELALKSYDYEMAESYYYEALKIVQNLKMKEPQAFISANLGMLYLDCKNHIEARKWCEQALALANEVRRVEVMAYAKRVQARVWEADDRADLALPLAQEALAIYERLQHRDLAATRELVARLTAAAQKKAK
jgi:tetratricopeptide (TPR) repeat protein